MLEEICKTGRMMYAKGLVCACEGNISVRTGDNEIWATPSGVRKGMLTPEMLVKTDMNGNTARGRPSSELKMHLRVYQELSHIKAVVHAHPTYACVYAIRGVPLDKTYLTESVITLGAVPVAPYATPSTDEVPESVAQFLHTHKAVLLANHGALTWGESLSEAYFMMESLESTAKIAYLTEAAGGGREIAPDKAEVPRQIAHKQP